MLNFNINTLKNTVRELMKKNGTTQKELADYLNMSQPNVSKALNPNDKKWFTLEQTYGLSKFFDVSIDYLVGRWKAHSVSNNLEIVEMLIALIESGAVSFDTITKKEQEYMPDYHEPGIEGTGYTKIDREEPYPVLYFRNYWTPIPTVDDFDGSQWIDLVQKGNYTKNYPINDFLQKYIPIYDLYEKGKITEKTYSVIVQDYLNDVYDPPYKYGGKK